MAPKACKDVYPKSFPWLASFILFFSFLSGLAYTAFYTNTVHLKGVYVAVLVLVALVVAWNAAAVSVMYRVALRTSLVLFSLSLILTLIILGLGVYLYNKDLDYLSHIEFVMIAVVIGASVISSVLLFTLITVLARFNPSQATVCRPFLRKSRV
jgi:hypothetical protein